MRQYYYYNSKLVTIISAVPNCVRDVIVKVAADYTLEDPAKNTVHGELYVKRSELHLPVSEVFPLNTRVRTKFNGGLHGHVVGYELKFNRAIVVSDKINKYDNDRTRYSYDIDTLEVIPKPKPTVTLEKGKFYKINSEIDVYAIRQLDDLISLVDRKGRVRHTDLAPVSDAAGLAMTEGIHNVQELRKGWM